MGGDFALDRVIDALDEQARSAADEGQWLRLEPRTGRFAYLHTESRRRAGGVDVRRWIVGGRLSRAAHLGERLVIHEIAITPHDPDQAGNGVDDHVLRSIRLTQLLGDLARRLARIDEATRAAYSAVAHREPYWEAPTVRRSGRSRTTARDEYLRELARAYIAVQGTGRGIYRELGQRFADERGNPKPHGTIREDIRSAHSAGWLGPAVHGRGLRTQGPRLEAYEASRKHQEEEQ